MDPSEHKQANWPYRWLLIMGFFGPGSPKGKRLMILSALGLFLFIAGTAGVQLLEATVWKYVCAVQIPTAALMIIYANTSYIKSLDTLEKLIQLTAFSSAYGAAIFIGITIFALHTVTGYYISPLWLLLAEPFRGMILFFITSKYQ